MDKKQQPKAVRRKSGQGGGRIFRSIVIVFLALVLSRRGFRILHAEHDCRLCGYG
ncbi:MAG: hypothetical protein ACLTDX_20545 [[Clostridium] innocuum]